MHADHIHPHSRGGDTSIHNGQALCARCNLKKGAKVVTTVLGRQWQIECFDKITKAIQDLKRDFLAVATPGAGKTRLALGLALHALDNDVAGLVVIVAPSRHLKKQWAEEAAKVGLSLRTTLTNDALDDGVPGDIHGYVVTYAQVANWPHVHAAICVQRQVLVVFDEVHHAGDDRHWGEGLRDGFADATFRLALSGTPFRTDRNAIPFVRYEDNRSVADYSYNYGRAMEDSVCRSIVFPKFEGRMEWLDAGELQAASFEEELDERCESRRLRTALTAGGDFLAEMIRSAHERLLDIRAYGGHPDAGGLVFAIDISHAQDIAVLMKKMLGVAPVVVACDDAEAHHKIAAFAKTSDLWMVAVRMVSEGVDIPRLRVGVYATNCIAELFFRQAVGRFVRMLEGLDEQSAYVYLPKDARFVKMAREIQMERDHVLTELIDKPEIEDEEGVKPSEAFGFMPLSSDGHEDGQIRSGELFSQSELLEARRIQKERPNFRNVPEADLAGLLRSLGHKPGGAEPVAAAPVASADVVNKKLRNECRKLVSALMRRTNPEALGQDYASLNNYLNAQVGIKATKTATNDQLRSKIRLCRDHLRGPAADDFEPEASE